MDGGVVKVGSGTYWNSPYIFSKITLGANELAPKHGQRDGMGRPRIGLNEDELKTVIVDKVVKELTMSNTGTIVRNSVNELFGI